MRLLAALAAGAGIGTGLLLLALGLYGRQPGPPRWRRRSSAEPRLVLTPTALRKIALGLAVGLVTLALTRWVAVAVGLGLLVGGWRWIFGATREATVAMTRLEALASWTESLRDMVAPGLALGEALPASTLLAPPAIRPQLLDLLDRIRRKEPLWLALRYLADDLADGSDGSADGVIHALIAHSRAQSGKLADGLTALASLARAELALCRRVAASRRATRRNLQTICATVAAWGLFFAFFGGQYVAVYRTTVTGQLVLVFVVGIWAVGFVWLRKLGRFATRPRLFGPASEVDPARRLDPDQPDARRSERALSEVTW